MDKPAALPPVHVAHLKECAVDLAYIDSGAPETADYTSLVCIHGHSYHAQTFRRLFPLAARHNIRVIALNRRDYAGSSPLSQDELALINSSDDAKHRQFLYDRGLELAYFLLWIVNHLKIPPASSDRRSGGLALLGWSLGNITSVAFMANLAKYPAEVTQALEPYLRHFFIYESTFQFLGFAPPSEDYHPLRDPDVAFADKATAVDAWFTSYFHHPYFSDKAGTRTRETRSLQFRTPHIPIKPSTSANRTPEELASIIDLAPSMRSELAFYITVQERTLHEQYEAALVLNNKSCSTKRHGLDLKVSVVYGTSTAWNIVWAAWETQNDLKRRKDKGVGVRPVEFVTIEGSNHFVLWDDPELLLKALTACLAT